MGLLFANVHADDLLICDFEYLICYLYLQIHKVLLCVFEIVNVL